MSDRTRPKFKDGEYLIECAICGFDMYSSEMVIGRHTNLPQHFYHPEENYDRFPVKIKQQEVPYPQSEPEDQFQSFDVDHTPTAISYD